MLAVASGCGGGGDSAPATTPEPETPPESITLLDSLPASGSTIDPATGGVHLVHVGAADLRFEYSGACGATGAAVRRSLTDLSSDGASHLVDHQLPCTLADATAYRVTVDATDGEESRYRSELEFSTGGGQGDRRLTVLDHMTTPAAEVNELFDRYVADALAAEIESPILAVLAALTIGRIADRSWQQLTARDATYAVVSQRVSYASSNPAGEPSALTGLVAMPEVGSSAAFEPRDRMVVLSHATGSTPGALDFADAWTVLANLIAGRGYLVIAPDNWGRGGSAGDAGNGTDQPETYLMANRVAKNTLDLVTAVRTDDDYRAFHTPGEDADVALVGYSQGGHSAVAVWLANRTGAAGVRVRELYSGGAPHNLYRTFRGAMQQLGGACEEDDAWCSLVEAEAVLPYFVDRLLPPLLAYTDIGLTRADVVDADGLASEFVTGILQGDAAYDALKTMLQLNSFTNILEPAAVSTGADTRVHLYHSPFDRLVPAQNTEELAALLTSDFAVAFHQGECAGSFYEALFDRVAVVGLVHAVCGMEMMDEVLEDLVAGDSASAAEPRRRGLHGRWRSLAERRARQAAASPEALASFRAGKSPEELRMLADLLREPGSQELQRLADLL